MGDEIALRNDATYLDDPELAADNRWMHRPRMDWTAAARRHDPSTVEGRVFGWLQRLGRTRRSLPALLGGAEASTWDVWDTRLLGWHRKHPRSGNFIGLANVAEEPVDVPVTPLTGLGFLEPVLASAPVDWRGDRWVLPPLGFLWLAER
ncbi:MAG: hypothetical protein H0T66_06415 [Geodermatophilaceae bacterium]|nr:hypothetical protein [Geodermatophilaceae bacterium]